MNAFQLIKTIFDEIYDQIPAASDEQKDAQIQQALRFLSQQYLNLLGGTPTYKIDYASPVTRLAYLYRYVTSHANLVHCLIRKTTELSGLFDAGKVRLTCIGGGPGSDFLGILKFMMLEHKNADLKCFLYDREQAWSES
jgi:hypothetical protein